jgi:hypothetical protein
MLTLDKTRPNQNSPRQHYQSIKKAGVLNTKRKTKNKLR